ncbi:MFS transporter [Nocardiopsis flavescens]|uniref:Predicted arabinose efflux permease, MFS family n=1 Tax=Nocardiopsis flavescens TaxID=758803 RepID=A0A1M6IKC2_9ACTN|nr:MFS transporter [Nocardiopsis flavescens]SHJ34942.1 Predicted arabinose efflux permease, MFS family [Nocardiopsis flavescens]
MTAAAGAPGRARLWDPPNRAVVAGVFGLMTFIAFESFAITTALPVIARSLEAEQWYSLAFAATATTGLVGMTVGGRWADLRGVRRPLVAGGALFLAGIALCALAPGMGTFVVGRLLQGVGGGIDSVVLYVVIARYIPEDLRPRMFGLLTAAWLLPSILGPLVTGALVELMHWRTVFALVLAGSALSLAVLLGATRSAPAPRGEGSPVGRRGVWAVAAAVAVLGLHVAGQQEMPWLAVGTVAGTAAAALAAGRLLPAGTLRARAGIPRLVAFRGVLGAANAATDIYLPLYLQHRLDFSPVASGAVVAIGAFGWALGAWVQGRAGVPAGSPASLRAAAALTLCGPVAALGLVTGVLPLWAAVLGCVLMGTGMGLAYPQVSTLVLGLSPAAEQGGNSSALQVSESLGTSLLIAVTGAVLTASALTGYGLVYGVVAGTALLAATLTLTFTRPPAPEAAEPAG